MEASGFSRRVTKDGRVRISFRGRHVVTVAGREADQLRARLDAAAGPQAEQLLLAKVTGNFKRGNERR